MEYIRTNHMMVVPEEHAHKDRLFLVRNPYDRLLSIYHHIVRKYTEWGYRYIKNMSFVEFIPWFLDQRAELIDHPKTNSYGAPGVWIRTAFENWDELTSDDHLERSMGADCYWFKIEDGTFFPWLVDGYSLKTRREEMPRSNSSDAWKSKIASGAEVLQRNRGRSVARDMSFTQSGWSDVGVDLKRRVDREWTKADRAFFVYSRRPESAL